MNWGNKLIVAFFIFAAGMAFMVYQAVSTDFELVEKDYYKKELRYQEVIDRKEATAKLSDNIALLKDEQTIILQLPTEMQNKSIAGDILFYCAQESKKDKSFTLLVDSNAKQVIALDKLDPCYYKVKISWSADGIMYYAEKDINIVR
jgi:hypothetical protein